MLVAGDPTAPRPFSGSARSLVRALQARGALHSAHDVTGWWDDPWSPRRDPGHLLARLRTGWLGHAAGSRRASRLAAAHSGWDACLLYGTTFFPSGAAPVYCYFDATVAQNARAGAWDTGWLPPRALQGQWERQRQVFAACAGLFPRSRWAGSTLAEDYDVPPEKVTVAGAGWNHEVEPPPHGPWDGQRALFLGRAFERKGGPELLAAFTRARAALPGARLTIVGCDPPAARGLPGVEVLGPIDKDAPGGQARLLQLLARTSLFCLPSRYEPFGVAVLEAMLSGVPCLVPDRFAFPEMVEDGVAGRTYPAGDVAALARRLVELLGDPAGLARMGAAARADVLEHWSWDRAAERICARVARDLATHRPQEARSKAWA